MKIERRLPQQAETLKVDMDRDEFHALLSILSSPCATRTARMLMSRERVGPDDRYTMTIDMTQCYLDDAAAEAKH